MKFIEMKRIWNALKWFFNHWLLANIVISVLVTLVTLVLGFKNFYIIGMLTFAGYGILVIIFINLRQLWWFITSTGDYEKKVDKKR